ncbi:MAG: hypothetical protein IKD46_06665 [Lentisphaeria bacterium]|nr:hypothetical protein [Lentisphaeria bacterium]
MVRAWETDDYGLLRTFTDDWHMAVWGRLARHMAQCTWCGHGKRTTTDFYGLLRTIGTWLCVGCVH